MVLSIPGSPGAPKQARLELRSADAIQAKRLKKEETPSLKKPPNHDWSGSYCIEPASYSTKNVGVMAINNKVLKQSLEGVVRVENTIAVPFGAVKQMLSSHHENVRPYGVIQRALKKISDSRESGVSTVEIEKHALRVCSRAVREIKIPAIMLDEIVDALVSSQMRVPCDLSGWERMRQSMTHAISHAFNPSILDAPGIVPSPFESFMALLIKDQEPREYDFTVSVSANGDIHGEIRLPYSMDRGMRFAAAHDCIRTTGQPKPHLGAVRDTSPVVLDGADLPKRLSMQHLTYSGGPAPPKLTLEGDNLLILPRHRCAALVGRSDDPQAIFRRVVDAASAVAQRMDEPPVGDWTVTGYINPLTEVVVEDVTSGDQRL